jgi:ribonuclease R
MAEHLQTRILEHLKSSHYQPQRPRKLARALNLHHDEQYPTFREALKGLMHEGRVALGARGTVVLPTERVSHNELIGTYRHNRRGFGFVIPTDPASHEDLFIPEGENDGAISGDVVRARITSRGQRDGKALYTGRITEILKPASLRFVGALARSGGHWMVLPDGNAFTEPILTPDAASRHIKPGTKVVVEMTSRAERGERAQGVITEVLGPAGQKDVDLRSIIVQYNLPESFPEQVLAEARRAVDRFDPRQQLAQREDLSGQTIVTIDPEDAKDYDDAISLRRLDDGQWELGVHIADVSAFVPDGSALDLEARERGNSSYFPGFVIPMLPEILSNGVCSLQERVPRLCKSAFITLDEQGAKPVRTRFANTVITSACRLRYREAQAIIDNAESIPHPDGNKRLADYPPKVVRLLHDMNTLAKRIQRRRLAAGQLVLELPEVDLVLDDEGRVVDAVSEDQSFTHTIIEMFMVEANEALARLLDSLDVPFLRRIHPEPDLADAERLRTFVNVAGYKLPKELDRKSLQSLLETVKGRPESFTINLAVLKSLTRAEYSPEPVGHFALASEYYCHFTSPIRRYADLTVHRLLDLYLSARQSHTKTARHKLGAAFIDSAPAREDLVELGRHLSFTERRSEDAEHELRKVKLLTLLQNHIGDEFAGVVTGITNFGIFIQLRTYLIDGLIRYENLMDDWWDVDERGGTVRGQRSGTCIGIGDQVKVAVVRIDLARRELDLAVTQLLTRRARGGASPDGNGAAASPGSHKQAKRPKHKEHGPRASRPGAVGGESRRRRHGRRR